MVQPVSGQPSRPATLAALRDRLTEAIDATVDPVALSSLALRLQRVLAELDDLGGGQAGQKSAVDELKARRAARRNTGT